MTDRGRSQIMAKLGLACRGASAAQISAELNSFGPAPAPALPADSTAESFLINVLNNHGSAECVANRSDAVKAIAKYLYRRFHSHKLVAGSDPRLAAMPWRDGGVLPRFGSAADGELAGLSYARLGVAETGSIVTWTGRDNPVANTLLVEDHLVLVDTADLVDTMEQAWTRLNQTLDGVGSPRAINFISGPSSTADIEATLVIGAHGPRAWHVILLGDLPPTTLENAQRIAGLNRGGRY